MKATLILKFEGPLQSFGYRSRFKDRDTGLEPTKSAIIGLLCCALGRDRKEPLDDLTALRMCVRVERQGKLLADFQTAGGGVFRGSRQYFAPKSSGGIGKNPILIDKRYLQDAVFLVALEGDRQLLETLEAALNDPVWPLSLGRRSCPPAAHVVVGIRNAPAEEALRLEPPTERADNNPFRLIRELPPGDSGGDPRPDVPVAWPDRQTRIYVNRYVEDLLIEVPTP